MRCKWCHNPETWQRGAQLQYIKSRCMLCGDCVKACPSEALTLTGSEVVVNRDLCTVHGKCAVVCPSEALSLVGREISAVQVVQKVVQDKVFYAESGGGITISGGEPLMQPEFTREILTLCRAEGIHTALETNLTVPVEMIEQFIPLVDLWMCDLKLADDELHRLWTGISNKQIIRNLEYLSRQGVPVVVRTPVVPGVNDTEEAIAAICRMLESVAPNVSYELLGFHSLGFDKFKQLGMDNPMPDAAFLDKDKLTALKSIAGRYNIKTI